jgi:Ca2+-binding EF-hand superfamily protein
LSKEEVKYSSEQMGLTYGKRDSDVFQYFDTDSDGELSYEEIVDRMALH